MDWQMLQLKQKKVSADPELRKLAQEVYQLTRVR
jgi:hypothetical protein